MKTFPGIVQLAYSALTYPNSISIGNHMILSAIIPKLREKACNCLWPRSKFGKVAQKSEKICIVFACEQYFTFE